MKEARILCEFYEAFHLTPRVFRHTFAQMSRLPTRHYWAHWSVLALMALAALFTDTVRADDALRCDGRLMGLGQSRIEVLKYCGEPQDRLAFLDERVTHIRFSNYQQGFTQFTRSSGSYVETSRDSVSSTPGDRDAKPKNGSAATIPQNHQHDETRIAMTQTEQIVGSYLILSSYWECKKVSIYVDEYVYNFGSGKFLTFVRFENGRVKEIKYGEYGF